MLANGLGRASQKRSIQLQYGGGISMQSVLPLLAGIILLALFVYGGKVQGGGERRYMSSAASAFLVPWIAILAIWLWIRFWSGAPFGQALMSLLPGLVVPVVAAFMVWRHFRQ